ncbi:hypothetical protein HY497_00690 [Candidatus Woesearchaeota archaeon]|nr:hypothetical protein [Candidatus Woesearchaeota archaeon]
MVMNYSSLLMFFIFFVGCTQMKLAADKERTADKANGITDERDGDADVEYVKASQNADGTWTFTVTVKHADAGWDDYADGWDVVADGVVVKKESDLFTRPLAHPHMDEQPFTRSQPNLAITQDTVTVRAHDRADGYGGREVTVDLREERGERFEVESESS